MAKRIGIMLAYKFDDKRFANIPKPVAIQPKLNGNRCRAIFDANGKVTLLSSSAAVINSINHIPLELEKLNARNIELDGELYIHGMPHQQINAIVRRTTTVHADRAKIRYNIFDLADDKLNQQERFTVTNLLETRAKHHNIKSVDFLETRIVSTMQEVIHYLGIYMSQGYEGIIIRNLFAKYQRKRSVDLLKYKPRISGRYPIVGWKQSISKVCRGCYLTPSKCTCVGGPLEIIEEMMPMLGAVECITPEGLTFHVGSGPFLTEHRRYALWKDRDSLIGLTADTLYHEMSVDLKPKSCVLKNIIGYNA